MQGFIYIWYNVRTNQFYLGSHYGEITDRYTGSGLYFKRAYDKEPENFKRRVLQVIPGTKADLLAQEQKWLNLIKDQHIGNRYYNLKKFASGGSLKGRTQPKTPEHIEKLKKPKANTINYKQPKSLLHRENISKALKNNPKIQRTGIENPSYSGISNELIRSEYLRLCKLLGKQPSMSFFRRVFNARTNLCCPLGFSTFRFNKGRDLYQEAANLGYLRSQSRMVQTLDFSQFLIDS